MKLENKYAPAPVVTDEEVNEHACTLARQEGCRDGRLLNLLFEVTGISGTPDIRRFPNAL